MWNLSVIGTLALKCSFLLCRSGWNVSNLFGYDSSFPSLVWYSAVNASVTAPSLQAAGLSSLEIWSIYSSAYYPHTALWLLSSGWKEKQFINLRKTFLQRDSVVKLILSLHVWPPWRWTALTVPRESCYCSKWVERREARQGMLPTSVELNSCLQDVYNLTL